MRKYWDTALAGDPAAMSDCDVVIELTNPSAADENVPRWRESGADVLIGTSGYTVDRVRALRDAWAGQPSRCMVVPNFAGRRSTHDAFRGAGSTAF